MSKKLVFVLIIFILLSSLLYVGLNPVVESTNSYRVWNYDTGLHYATIQEAINANETLDGHILYLDMEVFYEHVIVNKSVGLYGCLWIEHPEVITTIDGNGTGTVVTVEADNVTIDLIKIINGVNGVVVEEADNCLLAGLSVVDNAETGIYLHNSRNCTLKYSYIAGNRYNLGVEGSSAEHFFHKVVSSSANGKPIHYLTNEQDKSVTEDAGYIAAINCTNIIIENQNLTHNQQGLLLAYTSNSIIRNTNVSNNLYGIHIKDSNNNKIYHNNFINNTYQVFVEAIDGYPYNTWDDDYSSGGNYWSDYAGVDQYRGPNQDQLGSDEIGDIPYVIDGNNQDNYPLMNPYLPSEEMRVLYYDLLEKYNALNMTYYELLTNYNLLNSIYENLNATYNELKSKQEATATELNNIRNLMYIFITTTIIFIATTVYLATRKPKVKPELKTT